MRYSTKFYLGTSSISTYINHLAYALENCTAHHFADDINLIYGDIDPFEISHAMTIELRLLTEWIRANKRFY